MASASPREETCSQARPPTRDALAAATPTTASPISTRMGNSGPRHVGDGPVRRPVGAFGMTGRTAVDQLTTPRQGMPKPAVAAPSAGSPIVLVGVTPAWTGLLEPGVSS